MVASQGRERVSPFADPPHEFEADCAHRVDAQWIVAKRDWREAKRRHSQKQNPHQFPKDQTASTSSNEEEDDGTYNKDMDAMRCILFLHGGM